jgi:VWFA-related protein
MRHASKYAVLAAAAVLGARTAAQQFETGATAVVVDVVVRDKGGRLVTNLTPADFEVLEDGVAQRISSLELVGTPADGAATAGGGAALPTTPPTPPAGSSARAPAELRFTALVFDRLEPESINIARAGGEAAIAGTGSSDVAAVFVVDGGLRLVHGFTSDRTRLADAVGVAVQRAAMLISRNADGARYDGGGTPGIPGADTGSPGAFPAADIQMRTAIELSSDMLERQFQGHASIDALITVTAALSTFPGRKTLLYFSDSIAIPDTVLPRLQDVVATANRGQVTIYAVDATGLRTGSQDAATRAQIADIGRAGLAVNPDGSSQSSLAMLERNEDALRRAPRVGLTMLSKPTGGFLIENTNDLATGVRRIDADRRVHYLLSYAPARTQLDGRWRAIEVQVKRRDVTVQSRQGYVAVRSPGVLPVLGYEGPALAAIDRTPRPRTVATRTGAFAFPRAAPPVPGEPEIEDVAVVVAAPAAPLTFEIKGGSFRTDFTVLALVRDSDGQAIHKTSQPYRLAGPAADRSTSTGGEIRFARTLPMAPGSYRVWGAVHDAASGRAGVAEWPLQIEGRGATGLAVSSLVIVGRLERAAAAPPAPGDPFLLGDMVLTPNLGEFVDRTPEAALAFYFTVVGADAGEQLKARLQFFQNGTAHPRPVLLEVPVTLSPAGADGAARFLGRLPLARVPLGSLEILLRVDRFDKSETRAAYLNVREPLPEGATRQHGRQKFP